MGLEFDVFLSHNRQDQEAVIEIEQKLRASQLKPWLARWELEAGSRWRDEIENQLRNCRVAAVFIGADGVGPWQSLEIDGLLAQMVEGTCRVIPVILPSCPGAPSLPPFLKGITWVDFRQKDPDPFLQLVRGIRHPGEQQEPQRSRRPLHNLPFVSLGQIFCGRQEMLTQLEGLLVPGSATVLFGTGGVGKTRLAVEYAYRHAAHYDAMLFVGADNERNLRRNVAGLARTSWLGLGAAGELPEEERYDLVLQTLKARANWLLVLDNVDSEEAQSAVRGLLPLAGCVLITSRFRDWPVGIQRFDVDQLSNEDACEYLLKATEGQRGRRETDGADVLRIAERLDGLPLALELTAAYIRTKNFSFEELLKNWQVEEGRLLHWHDPATMDYPHSLATAWARSFGELDQDSQTVAQMLSQLAPEPVPITMFDHVSGVDFSAALEKLARYSLAHCDNNEETRTVRMHSLVQAAIAAQVPAELKTNVVGFAVTWVSASAPANPEDVRTWDIWEPLLPHIIRVLELAEKNAEVDARQLSALMNQLAHALRVRGRFSEAEPWLRRALEIDEAHLGAEHVETATALSCQTLLEFGDHPHNHAPLLRGGALFASGADPLGTRAGARASLDPKRSGCDCARGESAHTKSIPALDGPASRPFLVSRALPLFVAIGLKPAVVPKPERQENGKRQAIFGPIGVLLGKDERLDVDNQHFFARDVHSRTVGLKGGEVPQRVQLGQEVQGTLGRCQQNRALCRFEGCLGRNQFALGNFRSSFGTKGGERAVEPFGIFGGLPVDHIHVKRGQRCAQQNGGSATYHNEFDVVIAQNGDQAEQVTREWIHGLPRGVGSAG